MRQSQLFTKTSKEISKEETSFNAQALIRAGFIDKLGAGIYTFLPLGLRVLSKITNIIKEEMNSLGGQEVLMPALTPKSVWETTDRWDNFDALFKLVGSDSREYALGATHEEVSTPLAQKFCNSYKNLPFSIYQIQTKFRNEKRAKAGLMRGREFLMKDLYSFHTSQEDLDNYYQKAQKVYSDIYSKLGLGDATYMTYASGGAFSKYSHEFQTLSDAGEDLIYICDKCKIAINKEIIEEQDVCPECSSKELREAKAIEVGNIFKLGTRFSKAFNFNYLDKDGLSKEVVMGAYGIGISRLMATIVEVYNDDKGIIWPLNVAPFAVHLISFNQNEEAEKIYKELNNVGFEVLFDDRDSLSLGQKLNDADLIGCPYRLIVSQKNIESEQVEFKKRSESDIEMIKREDLINHLKNYVK
ncbi:MAG: aminoacyl--tRNA ligase-related protein [Patescibacteria group bacterium]